MPDVRQEVALAVIRENVPAARPQIAFNVTHYERVFGECLKAAERIAEQARLSEDKKLQVAEAMFQQFCSDQCDLAVQKIRDQSQKDTLQPFMNMLERRGMAL